MRQFSDVDAESINTILTDGIYAKIAFKLNLFEPPWLTQTAEQSQDGANTSRINQGITLSNIGLSYKVSIFDTQAKTYRQLQQAMIAQGKINSALEIAERGRSKAFANSQLKNH